MHPHFPVQCISVVSLIGHALHLVKLRLCMFISVPVSDTCLNASKFELFWLCRLQTEASQCFNYCFPGACEHISSQKNICSPLSEIRLAVLVSKGLEPQRLLPSFRLETLTTTLTVDHDLPPAFKAPSLLDDWLTS